MESITITMRMAAVLSGVIIAAGGTAWADKPGLQREMVRVPGTTVTFELVRIPGGEVTIGSEVFEVDELWAGVTEVTWDLYDVFLYGLDKPDPQAGDEDGVTRPSKPYIPPDRGFGHAGYPALGMTLHAAERFCFWLSRKTGQTYRLPTREEWVHMALAGSSGTGLGVPREHLTEYAWFEENADYSPHPVGKKKPNAWGLHDIHGNLAEWVLPGEEDVPFAMGGSYLDQGDQCSAMVRMEYDPSWQASDPQIPKSRWWLSDGGFVGLRVVREITSPDGKSTTEHSVE